MFQNKFWMDFGCQLGGILGPNWPSEATLKASVVKYANEEGSGQGRSRLTTFPLKIFSLEPQCERETGRASQADDTPNGVGGLLSQNGENVRRCGFAKVCLSFYGKRL